MRNFISPVLFIILLLVIPLIFFTILISALDTFYHESAHVEIFKNYGCYNITVNYGFLLQSGKTKAHCEMVSKEMKREIDFLNNLHHIISSNITAFFFPLNLLTSFLFILTILFLLEQFKKYAKES